MLGTRYPIWWVFTGVAAAFAVHVAVAVAAGALIAQLPHRLVEGVVAALFLAGAALLWRRGSVDEDVAHADAFAGKPGSYRVSGRDTHF